MNPIRTLRTTCLAAALAALLSGCGSSSSTTETTETPEPPDPAIEAARRARQDSLQARVYAFDCDKDRKFTAQVGKERAWLHLPDRTVVLLPSGAEFRKNDIVFSRKGDEASLSIGSDVYEACKLSTERTVWEAARLRGVTFRATGNEPGWYLEISGRRELLLVTDTGATERRIPDVDRLTEGDLVTWIARSGNDVVTVKSTAGPCQDTMSGAQFERTVTVQVGDMTYTGCGRELTPQ